MGKRCTWASHPCTKLLRVPVKLPLVADPHRSHRLDGSLCPQAKSITVTSDGREKAAEAAAAAPAAAPAAGEAPANVVEARQWIANWRAKSGGAAPAAGAAADVPANVAEARDWIRRWRAKQLEQKLPSGALTK